MFRLNSAVKLRWRVTVGAAFLFHITTQSLYACLQVSHITPACSVVMKTRGSHFKCKCCKTDLVIIVNTCTVSANGGRRSNVTSPVRCLILTSSWEKIYRVSRCWTVAAAAGRLSSPLPLVQLRNIWHRQTYKSQRTPQEISIASDTNTVCIQVLFTFTLLHICIFTLFTPKHSVCNVFSFTSFRFASNLCVRPSKVFALLSFTFIFSCCNEWIPSRDQ